MENNRVNVWGFTSYLIQHVPLFPPLSDCVVCEDMPIELVFIIDSSGSIGEDNFKYIKEFVKGIVNEFTIGPNTTRIGLVLYSEKISVVFNLDDGDLDTRDEIKNRVDGLAYLASGTYTGSAIHTATTECFSRSRPVTTERPEVGWSLL